MKKYFAILSALVILLCCLSSCSSNEDGSTISTPTVTVSDGVHFGTVADLLAAIKHDPYNYLDKEIQVKGTLCKFESDNITVLFDWSGSIPNGTMERYYFNQAARKNNIEIIIPDEIMYTVVEDGDYITIYGTVKISDSKIYLDNCTYTLNS